jgi:hypothetical protein
MKVQEKKVDDFNTKMVSMNGITVGIATDIGPRILYVASNKRPELNLFGVLPDAGVQTSEGFWRLCMHAIIHYPRAYIIPKLVDCDSIVFSHSTHVVETE